MLGGCTELPPPHTNPCTRLLEIVCLLKWDQSTLLAPLSTAPPALAAPSSGTGTARGGAGRAGMQAPLLHFFCSRTCKQETGNRNWSNCKARPRLFSVTASLLLLAVHKPSIETPHHEFICRAVFQFLYEPILFSAPLIAKIVCNFKETALFLFFSICQETDNQIKNIPMILLQLLPRSLVEESESENTIQCFPSHENSARHHICRLPGELASVFNTD